MCQCYSLNSSHPLLPPLKSQHLKHWFITATDMPLPYTLTPMVSNRGKFASQGTLGAVCRPHWWDAPGMWWTEARDAAKYPKCPGHPHHQEEPGPKCQQCRGWPSLLQNRPRHRGRRCVLYTTCPQPPAQTWVYRRSSMKTELAVVRWMNLESVMQSEVKSEREKQISYMNTYIWNLENGIDEPICRAEIET